MERLCMVFACVALLGLSSGCSDEDCDPCAPIPIQPLAEYYIDAGVGSSGGYDSVRVLCYYSATPDTLYDLYVDEADEGHTITIDGSNNPDFNEAVAILTNGEDDYLYFYMLYPNGGGGGSSGDESDFLNGGLTRQYYPDLAGAEVTEIRLYMESISIDNQGSWTSCNIQYQILFMGRP